MLRFALNDKRIKYYPTETCLLADRKIRLKNLYKTKNSESKPSEFFYIELLNNFIL